ncbi:MAG: L,D-transpeptidase family protein [Rhodobacteraceae bacterium]|nr:L,D-transpeptidase family protein [Paracoccaceae bacterium]
MLHRLSALALVCTLAACGAPSTQTPPTTTPGYEGFQDGEFYIAPVDAKHLTPQTVRTEVAYAGDEAPGSIVVDIYARKLYHVMEGGRATRYGIAVGREGLSFQGNATVGRKQEWPSWTPTANMIRTQPEMYADYAGGLPGGLNNPLGARALYLYRGNRDTYFRIHGTIDNASIGRATSAGCIRLFNQDAIHLFENVTLGTPVKVRTQEESLAAEGPYMDDAYGRAIPETPEAIRQKEREAKEVLAFQQRQAKEQAAEQARLEREAEKANRKRLAACRRQGLDSAACPPADGRA